MIKPLKPTVTLEEFLAVVPGQEETYTSSPVVNAVVEAFAEVRPFTEREIGRRLHVDGKKLFSAMEIITSHGFTELRYFWLEKEMARMKAENPKVTKLAMAHRLGFADNSSFSHFLRCPSFKQKKRINIRKDENHEHRSYDSWKHN